MKRDEFIKLVLIIRTSYPANNFLPTKESIDTWYEMLKDLDFDVSFKAVQEYIKNNDYPPTIAGVRKGCVKNENILADTWDQAWNNVMIAVKKYGTYGAKEAMESLDELTRKSVKAIGFYEVCTSSNTSYLRREFKDIYEQNKADYDYTIQSQNNNLSIESKGGNTYEE